MDSYVVPVRGAVKLQQLTAPQLQAFYEHLLTIGRVKVDTVSAMYELWRQGREAGKEPTARRLASTTGATIHAARAALRRFRTGQVPKGHTPGLAPKTVRNVHVMLHKALADATGWKYVTENVAAAANAPKPGRRRPTVGRRSSGARSCGSSKRTGSTRSSSSPRPRAYAARSCVACTGRRST